MQTSSFPCCLWFDVAFVVIFALKLAMDAHMRDEDGVPRGTYRSQREGWNQARKDCLVFLVVLITNGALFYLIYYEPNVHAGRPVPWDDLQIWLMLPLVAGLVYFAIARQIILRLYKPDS